MTQNPLERAGAVIGDLIPVKIVGEDTGYSLGCKSWDIIASCMGIDTLLYNLIDEPEYMNTHWRDVWPISSLIPSGSTKR